MKFHTIGLVLPLALASTLASCAHRQQTYGGPIIPIDSIPLPRPPVTITTPPHPRSMGCTCRRNRNRATTRRDAAPSPPTKFRYSNVLTDPAAHRWRSEATSAAGASTVGRPVVGVWKVTGTPAACSLRLSSQSMVDVKRASVSGCQGSALQNVIGWRSSGTTFELLEPGGHVPAKFDVNAAGGFTSIMTDDGRSLRLSR